MSPRRRNFLKERPIYLFIHFTILLGCLLTWVQNPFVLFTPPKSSVKPKNKYCKQMYYLMLLKKGDWRMCIRSSLEQLTLSVTLLTDYLSSTN
jgi:hypothetical protein